MAHSASHRKAISDGLKKYHAGKGSSSTNWISSAIKKPGSLHRALHIKQNSKIPLSALNKAKHSKNSKIAKEANLAITLKKFHH